MEIKQIVLAISGIAMSISASVADAATAQGVITNVKSVTDAAGTIIPSLAALAGGALLFYFFVLMNQRGDKHNGHEVPISKLIFTGLSAGGLLGWSASQGIFTSLF